MKNELQEKLFEKYPIIFQDHTKSECETCMCWGLETGDGWYDLIENLCKELTAISNEYDIAIIADQVKEKFGTLRFYYHTTIGKSWTQTTNEECVAVEKTIKALDHVHVLIKEIVCKYEDFSGLVCETCGSTINVETTGRWISTLCKTCREKNRNEKQN